MFLYLIVFGFIIITPSSIMTFSNKICFCWFSSPLFCPTPNPSWALHPPQACFLLSCPTCAQRLFPSWGLLSSFTASRTLCWYLTRKSGSAYEGKLVILAFQSLGLILYNTSQVHPFSHNSTMFFFFPSCLCTTPSLSIHQLMDS